MTIPDINSTAALPPQTDTRAEYEAWINEIPVAWADCKSNGGRIPDNAKYGSWLRRNDPIAFNVGYQEWTTENQYARSVQGTPQSQPCPQCGGLGIIDTGGVTPWGAWIHVTCPTCGRSTPREEIATLNHLVAEFDQATDYRYDYVASRDMLIVLASLPECRRGLADDLDRALRAVEGGAL